MTVLSIAGAAALALVLCAGTSARAQNDQVRTDHARPISAAEYVQQAAIGNQFEIESSKLALQKTRDPAIKSFAQEMVSEHTTATSKLTEAAKTAKIDMAARQRLDRQHQETLAALSSKSGPQFDQAYMRAQLLGHREALNLQKAYGESGDNPALKAHAQEIQPTVQHHLKEAEKLAAVRGNDTNRGGDTVTDAWGNLKVAH